MQKIVDCSQEQNVDPHLSRTTKNAIFLIGNMLLLTLLCQTRLRTYCNKRMGMYSIKYIGILHISAGRQKDRPRPTGSVKLKVIFY